MAIESVHVQQRSEESAQHVLCVSCLDAGCCSVETSMGGSFSYEDDCDGDATHDSECEALRAAGYTVGVFAIAQLVAAVGIFLAAWRERWMLPAWCAVIAVAVFTLLGIFVFLGQFPFRCAAALVLTRTPGSVLIV